jgi:hypothetical protein
MKEEISLMVDEILVVLQDSILMEALFITNTNPQAFHRNFWHYRASQRPWTDICRSSNYCNTVYHCIYRYPFRQFATRSKSPAGASGLNSNPPLSKIQPTICIMTETIGAPLFSPNSERSSRYSP